MALTIRYAGQGEALYGRRDVFAPEIFSIDGDGYDIKVLAVASGTLGEMLEHDGLNQAELVRRAGLTELESRLAAGEVPQESDEGYIEILYSSDQHADLARVHESAKSCDWQVRGDRGLECDATPVGQDRSTTLATCAKCAMPDARIVCAQLRHPTNLPVRTFGGFERLAGPAMCELGNEPDDGSDCRPGGKNCWQRIVSVELAVPPFVGGSAVAPGRDLSRTAVDAIDHLRETYRRRYGADLWLIDQARSIAELSGEAHSEETFHRKVTVLALLLSTVNPQNELDDELRLGANGQAVGGLVVLERLMERDLPDAVRDVRMLRHIAALRNAYPTHLRARGFEDATSAIGLDYPPDDWDAAWRIVLSRFGESLRRLRLALAQ
jgi:hypothetical protein